MPQIYACEESRHCRVTAWRRPPAPGGDSEAQHMGPTGPRTLKLDNLPAACLAKSAGLTWIGGRSATPLPIHGRRTVPATLGTDLNQRHSLQVQLRRTLRPDTGPGVATSHPHASTRGRSSCGHRTPLRPRAKLRPPRTAQVERGSARRASLSAPAPPASGRRRSPGLGGSYHPNRGSGHVRYSDRPCRCGTDVAEGPDRQLLPTHRVTSRSKKRAVARRATARPKRARRRRRTSGASRTGTHVVRGHGCASRRPSRRVRPGRQPARRRQPTTRDPRGCLRCGVRCSCRTGAEHTPPTTGIN